MIRQFEEFFKGQVLRNRQDLFEAINSVGPMLPEGWSLAKPLSGSKILRFVPVRARQEGYIEFAIPKKSGGQRKISAPVDSLKLIQQAINVILQSVFVPSKSATGFVVGKSIKDNALIHVGQTCVYNIDLENFFPSINKAMVRSALQVAQSKFHKTHFLSKNCLFVHK